MSEQMFQALSYREARDKGKIDLAEELQREVAAKAGELTENPVRRIDNPRIDRRGKVRFLIEGPDPALDRIIRSVRESHDTISGKLRTEYPHTGAA